MLQPGQRISHYEIVEKIGEGGMGAVWKAEDTVLRRTVAVKVLPAEIMHDDDRREMFLSEARLAASVGDAHIVQVHEFGKEGDLDFIVMEYVEGHSLRQLMHGRPLPPHKVVRFAGQIAGALARAHRKGLIHRDLKPANILVTPEGEVKVVDFGLATLFQRVETTLMTEATTRIVDQDGGGPRKLAGTLPYMSPEQVRLEDLDARSDIFSLGTILYEMTTGHLPFVGVMNSEVIREILRAEPVPAHDLVPKVPLELDRIIAKAMAPKRGERYQTMDDLAVDLRRLGRDLDSGSSPSYDALAEPAVAREKRRTPPHRAVLVAAATLLISLALVVWWFLLRQAPPATQAPPAVTLTQLTSRPGPELFPSLSPDGKTLVYVAGAPGGSTDIFQQRVGGRKLINLTETPESNEIAPSFSPDGELIAFRRETGGEGGIHVMGAMGESARRLTDFGFDPAWSPDGSEIVFATRGIGTTPARTGESALWVVTRSTGETRQIHTADAIQPHWSPDGRRIAFWSADPETSQRDIWTIPSAGGEAVAVTRDAAVDVNPLWSPDGRHLYFCSDRGGSMNLWRVAIETSTGEARGAPVPITSATSGRRFHAAIASASGDIVWADFTERADILRVPFDPLAGESTGPPVSVIRGSLQTISPSPSPDGGSLAFTRLEHGGARRKVFVSGVDGAAMRQLIDDDATDRLPRWSPDGTRILFLSDRGGGPELWTSSPDGTDLRQITDTPGGEPGAAAWSHDGTRLAYLVSPAMRSEIVDLTRPRGEDNPRPLPAVDQAGGVAFVPGSWSPDGLWLAGSTGPRGPVFLYSVDAGTYRKVFSAGERPLFLGDGRRLLVRRDRELLLGNLETGKLRPIFSIDPPASVGPLPALSRDDRWIYYTQTTTESDVWLASLDRGSEGRPR